MEVRELSIGDYVLNGGEVAALAIVEAVVRLLPGFMGNAESLTEESHAAGLLEYPVYTKPDTWRGHQVPDVLLSGDHARIARWRHDQSVRRTADRRPDLAHPSTAVDLGELEGQLDARRACRCRGAAHPAAGVLGPGAAGEPGRGDPGAPGGPGRRAGVAAGVDHARAPLRRSPHRSGTSPPRRRHLGHRPDHGRPGPPGQRDRSAAADRDRGGRTGRRCASSCCSPARAACATSGCTRRPAIASSVPTPRLPAPYA